MSIRPYFVSHGHPTDSGTILVFAESRNQARAIGEKAWPGLDAIYWEMNARLAGAKYSVFALSDQPHAIDGYDGPWSTWSEALKAKLDEK